MSSKKKVPANSGGSLKEIEKKRRQVFKPILDNPYTQTNVWPFVEPEVAESVMGMLSVILSNLGRYNGLLAEARVTKNVKFVKPESPEILRSITVGFNSTVRALEEQAQRNWGGIVKKESGNGIGSKGGSNSGKTSNSGSSGNSGTSGNSRSSGNSSTGNSGTGNSITNNYTSPYIKFIFVTKYDITPTILTNPLPVLCYTASKSLKDPVKLIQLPRGSMTRLSSILNIEHTGIIGLAEDIRQALALYELVEKNISNISVPWLEDLFTDGTGDLAHLVKPNLKFLVTSAPILPRKNDQKNKVENKNANDKEKNNLVKEQNISKRNKEKKASLEKKTSLEKNISKQSTEKKTSLTNPGQGKPSNHSDKTKRSHEDSHEKPEKRIKTA